MWSVHDRTVFHVRPREGCSCVENLYISVSDTEIHYAPGSAPDPRVSSGIECLNVVVDEWCEWNAALVTFQDDESAGDCEAAGCVTSYFVLVLGRRNEDFPDDAAESVRAAFVVGEGLARTRGVLGVVSDNSDDVDCGLTNASGDR